MTRAIDEKSLELEDLSRRAKDLKEEYEGRASDDGMNSNARVIRLREALGVMKKDIVQLGLNVGLIGDQLLERRRAQARDELQKRMKKQGKLQQRGKARNRDSHEDEPEN
jgi:hypothetical protein